MMKALLSAKSLLVTGLILFSHILTAQLSFLDSLEMDFVKAKTPSEKIYILKDIFSEIQFKDPEKALVVAKEMDFIANQQPSKDEKLKLESFNIVGMAYMNLNKNDSALYYFQQTLELAKELKDSSFLAKSYNNIGTINYYQGNSSGTLYYFTKSAEIEKSTGDIEGYIISLMNIGSLYIVEESLDSARFFLTKGLSAAIEIDDKSLIAVSYTNLGVIDQNEKKYKEAKQNFFKAIEFGEMISDYDLISMSYRNLAKLFQEQGMYKIAVEYDLKSLEYALACDGLSGAKAAYFGLAVSYEKLGMFKEAYENHKEYTAIVDTIRERQNRSSFLEMQEKYKSEQAAIENQMLTQQNEIQNLEIAKSAEELANSRIIIISSVLGLFLLIILAFTLYNRNILKQRTNLKLLLANEIINEKNRDITASIEYASKIQEALLPTRDNQKLFKDSFFLLQPKDIVSGDFFWYAEVDGTKIVAAIDCTGHGVPGAFMSMIGNTFLHEIVNEKKIVVPDMILNELRVRVIRALNQKGDGINRKDGMDMSICAVNEAEMTLEFSGANNPLYIVQNNEIKELKGDKQPVGYFAEKQRPFTNHKITINSGDCIYLFSDGYADQFGGPKGKKFKYKQLRDLLYANCSKPMSEQKKILVSTFEDWKGGLEQVDDVCIVGFRI